LTNVNSAHNLVVPKGKPQTKIGVLKKTTKGAKGEKRTPPPGKQNTRPRLCKLQKQRRCCWCSGGTGNKKKPPGVFLREKTAQKKTSPLDLRPARKVRDEKEGI